MSTSLVLLGRAVGDPSRVAMLIELFDHPGASLGHLANAAQVSPSTASAHINVLEEVGLVSRTKAGRSIAIHFADDQAAALVEQLLAFDPSPEAGPVSTKIGRLRCARTCYDHLAGHLGVQLAKCLVTKGVLDSDLATTSTTDAWMLDNLEVDLAAVRAVRSTRSFTRACLDWTERQPHLAGRLGTEVLHAFHRHRWIAKHHQDRSLHITSSGRIALHQLGIAPASFSVDSVNPNTTDGAGTTRNRSTIVRP
jgi:DNA-binding transcriptional ArsR family regulator